MKGDTLLAVVGQRLFRWAGDGSLVRKMRRREGGGDVAVGNGGNGLQCKWPYQVLSLSGAVNSLGSERMVKVNGPIQAGRRKISLSFTPSRGFFFFPFFCFDFSAGNNASDCLSCSILYSVAMPE